MRESETEMDALIAGAAFLSVKLPTILVASFMALIGFLLDSRKHSVMTAALAIVAGAAVAVLLTDPVSDYFHLADGWRNALAGILGIGGRNLIMVVNRIAKDPAQIIRIWRGEDGGKDE